MMMMEVMMMRMRLGGDRSGGDAENESGGDEKFLDHGREPCRYVEPYS